MFALDTIQVMDCLEGLRQLPDACIDSCVTSPPYWLLRDYAVMGQLGQEPTPEAYVVAMVRVFDEVRRVLKPQGTLWLNLGDSYAGNRGRQVASAKGANKGLANMGTGRGMKAADFGLKPKDLVGIPWMAAFALRAAGWYLRQDIIWHKPNCTPESVTDRCTRNHEYIFLLSKSPRYYYDHIAIKTPLKRSSVSRYSQDVEKQAGSNRVPGKTNGPMKAIRKADKQRGHGRRHAGFNERWDNMTKAEQQANGANKRSVWTVAPRPFKEAHFATYPPELIIDCIKAGCPPGGVVLDPFMGSGTTALVASVLGRHFIGFEINPAYVAIADKRLRERLGFFLPTSNKSEE